MDIKDFIEDHIPKMDSAELVYKLFHGLGYKTLTPAYRGKEAWGLKAKDKQIVKTIYTVADYKRFKIFLVELKSPSSAIIRSLPLYFERETQYPFFVVTHDYQNYTFVLVEKLREDAGVWKRKITKLNLDRENAYYTDKWILSEIGIDTKIEDPKAIYNHLQKAFSVEKVTRRFFDEYKELFKFLEKYLLKQISNRGWCHDYSLQLLNRLMFLYFVQKKRWLDNNPRFITDFWKIYKESMVERDSFYEKWLSVLFFEAFNNRFFSKPYFPDKLNTALALAPYLNGGLFTRNKLDAEEFKLNDDIFTEIFKFFDRYNFTIREELPLEVEVAVDPEMIGKVYESLVNVSEEADERGEAGIFYTARTEIDFMCRRSLVEYFHNHLEIDKPLIYEFIFAKSDEEKRDADKKISRIRLWEKIETLLDDLTVVDPACGSGSFLVGMLNILSDLYKRTYAHLNRKMSDFDIKKSIIGRSLYGVDVMNWAVHIAELRLWLQLIIETELTPQQLKIQPLLPNLTFKIRAGDSLVQEIGGINLAVRTELSNIPQPLKKKLTALKFEKLKFYNNDPSCKFKSADMLLKEELNIFRSILDYRIIEISKRIKSLKRTLASLIEQEGLFKQKVKQAKIKREEERIEKEIPRLESELQKIKTARFSLKGVADKPFVWDIDFVEIFSDEKTGFDIVIGNPPYVRQEKIAPPLLAKENVTNELKREYKDKLEASIKVLFGGKLPGKLDRKSDLYIYFYFHGLGILNSKGTFCFITSNSWLDVGYGKNLQQFLLENTHIKAIYDNSAKRSFTQADINTIIALLSAPFKKTKEGLKKTAKFVLFKKPFEDVGTAENLIKIDEVDDKLNNDSYRVITISQKKLLEEGWEYPEKQISPSMKGKTTHYPSPPSRGGDKGEGKKSQPIIARDSAVATRVKKQVLLKDKFLTGRYTGNKWGGKYLRAPDIFFTILEKGKGKLVRLGDIAEVRFGIKTGCNEFFYLPSKHFDIKKEGRYYRLIPKHEGLPDDLRIEEEYLPVSILSPKNAESIVVNKSLLPKRLLLLHPSDSLSQGLRTYIKWGESMKFDKRPSCKTREKWYALAGRLPAPLVCNYLVNDYMRFYYNEDGLWVSDNFQEIRPFTSVLSLAIILNSLLTQLFINMVGRYSFGGGLLKIQTYEVAYLEILSPLLVKQSEDKLKKVLISFGTKCNISLYKQVGINPKQPIRSQKPKPLPDRKALDDIIFDILGLTQEERNEVYWAVCELVKNRLEKARSV